MRIALVANSAWNIQNFVKPLIHRLSLDHKLTIICPEATSIREFRHLKRLNWTEMDAENWSLLQEWVAMRELKKILSIEEVDLAILFTIKPIIYNNYLGSGKGRKIISVVTGLGQIFLKETLSSLLARKLFFRGLKKSDVIVVQNEDDAQLIGEKLPEKKDIKVIHGSGVDANYFSPGEAEKKYDFVYLGRCIYEKGLGELIAACHQLHDEGVPFSIVVAGPWESNNQRYIDQEEWASFLALPEVTYLGEVTDVWKVLNESRMMILPSYREGLSRALLEAMSMELPILVSDVPGCRSLVQQANGWIFESRNTEALFQAMRTALNTEHDTQHAMGQVSRQMVFANYAEDIIVKDYVELVNN